MILWVLIIATLHLLGLFSAVKAVMETRTSQGAIAWVIFLISFPYISLPIYWILGRSRFQGYLSVKHAGEKKIQEKLDDLIESLTDFRVPDHMMTEADAVAEKLAHLPYLRGNAVELLIDGDATFGSILSGIDDARSYILFQFYIVRDDEIGRQIKSQLIAKAEEGVKVYFLYDEIGSHHLSASYIHDLRQSGVRVHEFHTQKGWNNHFQVNFRNHRKIVVIDGQSAWIGGHNVGDEYLGRDPKFGHWRDTHVKLTGPVALAAQISFIEDWYWAAELSIPEITWIPVPAKKQDREVLIVPSGPADELETAGLMFHHAIISARKRIWIASPYFVPDDTILSALQLAGLRGVDVRILIPDKPDHLLVYLAAYTYFEDAAKTGVRFFRYTDGFLHQKVMLIDDDVSTVGTANFDNRSFRLNFEVTSIVKDRAFALEIEKMLLDDFSHSKEMSRDDIDSRSFWFRLAARLARLTSPIL